MTSEIRRLQRLAGGYNRKARQHGLRDRITADDLLLIERMVGHCVYCGMTLEIGHGSFDHAIPFDKGGRNTFENIVRCCMTCQRSKWTKTPTEHADYQELTVECSVCGTPFKPRWAEWKRGYGRTCSRSCAGSRRWLSSTSTSSTPAPDALAGRPRTGT